METTKKTQVVGIKNAGIVIICCLVIAVCIFQFLLGNPSNFMNNDPNNHPLNMLGTIYKGGYHRAYYPDIVVNRTCFEHRALFCSSFCFRQRFIV